MAMVKAYSWHPYYTNAPSVSSMLYLSTGDTSLTPEGFADSITDELLTRPLEDRVVHLWDPVPVLNDYITYEKLRDVFVDGVDQYAPGIYNNHRRNYFTGLSGPSLPPLIEWYTRCFQQLKNSGVELGGIVCDEESGFVSWSFDGGGRTTEENIALLEPVLALDDVIAVKPSYMIGVTASDVFNTVPGRNLYDKWTVQLRADCIRKSVCPPYAAVFGRLPRVSNYGDMASPYLHKDNGRFWPQPNSIISNVVSPVLYLGWGIPPNPIPDTIGTDYFWLYFVDLINIMRGNIEGIDTNGGLVQNKVIPWVPFYGFMENFNTTGFAPASVRFLQEHIIRHGIASGISEWILWNPHNVDGSTDADEKQFAKRVNKAAGGRKVLPQLTPAETTVVISGDVVTRYSTFRKIRDAE